MEQCNGIKWNHASENIPLETGYYLLAEKAKDYLTGKLFWDYYVGFFDREEYEEYEEDMFSVTLIDTSNVYVIPSKNLYWAKFKPPYKIYNNAMRNG